MELTDAIAEGLLRTVMKHALILRDDPSNYDSRAEVMWAGSLSHNGLTGCGNDGGDFACHGLEHELGGMFDVTHGAGLTALWPTWARYVFRDCLPRFVRFARNVMDIAPGASEEETALAGIDALNIAIPEKGYNFTRVELTPLDDLGRPAYVPLHLRLETSETPNEPGSTSVVLDFDCDGRAYSVLINQFFEDGAALRVVAGRDDGRRDVYVQKVYDVPAPNAEPQEIYYRHHRPHWAQRKYGPDRDDRRW